jgi:hypothetical protein
VTQDHRPIIVVGCPRSGTTMLQLMLHAHERIAIPPENRFVLRAYQNRRELGDLTVEENRRRLAHSICKQKGSGFGDLGLDADATMAEIVAGPPTLGSACGIVLRAYARKFGKPRWGDKRPSYLVNLHMVRDLFPDAQVVHIIRDGRDCVASLKEAPWHRGGIPTAIAGWCRGMDEGARAARTLPPGSYFELYYERLVSDPEPELRRLCEFLGERFDPAMTEPSAVADVAVPERKTWHALTHGEVTAKRVGSWARRLDPAEIGLCEAVMGRRLVAHGYSLSRSGSPTLAEWARYLPALTHDRMSRAKRALTTGFHHVRPRADLADRLATPATDPPVPAPDAP